MYLTQLKILR